jgi:leukotriene-A4 hydrolase
LHRMGDPASNANIAEVRTTHLQIELEVDFERKVLHGHVDLGLEAVRDGLRQVVLDTRDLAVTAVDAVPPAGPLQTLQFALGQKSEAFGQPLVINLNEAKSVGTRFVVRVHYETSPNASGLQWLPPSQTEGKKYPYLFSQFEAIHCRSTVPCQDSPSIKAPYAARVTVPKPLVALMSALSVGETEQEGKTTFVFHQRVPIPSYLIAFVVGNLVSKDIGPRSKVWTEPEKAEAAAWEFANTEEYLKTAEELLTPYEWGRYDILMLPSSFPYGGMENPCLTFVTPSLLAGDRSLTDVVAHEIAHSWMGNLVTNRTWEHFWLNEGFTVFIERKIIGRLRGEKHRQFSALLGNHALVESIAHFGQANQEFTKLIQNQQDADPDDAFSSVPYEKGSQFLYFLELTVGGAALFEPFLQAYVKKFAHSTLTSEEFKDFFLQYFNELPGFDASKLDAIDWDAWFNSPGLPPVDIVSKFDDSLAVQSNELAKKWALSDAPEGNESDIQGWSTPQLVAFLEKLTVSEGLNVDKLARMEKAYHFTQSRNAEIRFRWYTLAIRHGFEEAYPHVVSFLEEHGRMKFVRPLYRELFHGQETAKQLAIDTFSQYKNNYHPICSKMVAKDMGIAT